MINFLVITPNIIFLTAFTLFTLYFSALYFIIKNKSGYIPVILLIIFPIVGPLAIIIKNLIYKK